MLREREMFIGPQFSNLYTLVDTSARGRVGLSLMRGPSSGCSVAVKVNGGPFYFCIPLVLGPLKRLVWWEVPLGYIALG
jgi:hypothetical protein